MYARRKTKGERGERSRKDGGKEIGRSGRRIGKEEEKERNMEVKRKRQRQRRGHARTKTGEGK